MHCESQQVGGPEDMDIAEPFPQDNSVPEADSETPTYTQLQALQLPQATGDGGMDSVMYQEPLVTNNETSKPPLL